MTDQDPKPDNVRRIGENIKENVAEDLVQARVAKIHVERLEFDLEKKVRDYTRTLTHTQRDLERISAPDYVQTLSEGPRRREELEAEIEGYKREIEEATEALKNIPKEKEAAEAAYQAVIERYRRITGEDPGWI